LPGRNQEYGTGARQYAGNVPRYKKTQHVINPVSIRRNDEKGREMRFRIAAVAPVIWLMTSTGIARRPLSMLVFHRKECRAAAIIRTLDDAHDSIRLMGYSFTSPDVVKSLVAAKRRARTSGSWWTKDNSVKPAKAAMNVVASAGIPLRTNGQYKIMHDKVIITDGQNVELGSFNYTRSAANANSENALVTGYAVSGTDLPGALAVPLGCRCRLASFVLIHNTCITQLP
jgi:phosphatidylserine/phosphatidylglycerophosphate/cardiolipin synthase-like enzyme